MRSYPYINELFKNILAKSAAIQGRFYLCPRGGIELNADDLEQVIKDLLLPDKGKKYPLVLMPPPGSRGRFTDPNGEWETYRMTLFFLTTTYNSSTNQVKSPNPNTRTSMHTVPDDWHDMKRCAVNFIRAVRIVQKEKRLVNSEFRLPVDDIRIDPVAFIGIDNATGVRIDFNASVFIGCEMEDYNPDDLAAIAVPAADSHPQHNL